MPDNAAEVFPVDDLLHSAHPREMLPLFRPNVPRGGPIFKRREHKPYFFGPNPYEKPRNAYSLSFWTQEQAIYYIRVLYNMARISNINTLICLQYMPQLASRMWTKQLMDFMLTRCLLSIPDIILSSSSNFMPPSMSLVILKTRRLGSLIT